MSVFSEFSQFVKQNVPLGLHSWLQIGGNAEYYAEPRRQEELVELVKRCHNEGIPIRVLGYGSNVLISEKGVFGVVLRLSEPEFCSISSEQKTLTAGGGAKLGRVVTHAVHAGLAGLEGLTGIPGSVGGALQGNACTNHGEIGQCVDNVTVLNRNGEIIQLGSEDITFSYRNSTLDDIIILSAQFKLHEDDPIELSKRLQNLWIVRKTQQPMGHQCGCMLFKSPAGMNAHELIEKAGLKGTRIGGAVIYDRNANYAIVEPECTSSDLLRLIDIVREQVAERLEVELELDLEIW